MLLSFNHCTLHSDVIYFAVVIVCNNPSSLLTPYAPLYISTLFNQPAPNQCANCDSCENLYNEEAFDKISDKRSNTIIISRLIP